MSEIERVLQSIQDDLYYNGDSESPISREYLYTVISKLRDAVVHDATMEREN